MELCYLVKGRTYKKATGYTLGFQRPLAADRAILLQRWLGTIESAPGKKMTPLKALFREKVKIIVEPLFYFSASNSLWVVATRIVRSYSKNEQKNVAGMFFKKFWGKKYDWFDFDWPFCPALRMLRVWGTADNWGCLQSSPSKTCFKLVSWVLVRFGDASKLGRLQKVPNRSSDLFELKWLKGLLPTRPMNLWFHFCYSQ